MLLFIVIPDEHPHGNAILWTSQEKLETSKINWQKTKHILPKNLISSLKKHTYFQ